MPRKVTPKGQAARPPKVATPAAAKKKAAPRKKKAEAEVEAKPLNFYIRNIRGTQCRVTLDDDRFLLEPRGQRGDVARITDDHMADPNFEPNIGMIYEILNEEQAKDVLRKQANNQQVGPTTIDYLLNPLGQPYERGPRVEQAWEQQGQVVAQIHDTGQGRYSEHNQEITRGNGAPPLQANVPGSIGNPGPQVPSHIPADQVSDWIARNTPKGENSNAGDVLRNSLSVRVDPTQPGL